MAVTLRASGSNQTLVTYNNGPLTHTQMDANFTQFFISASLSGSSILLYKPYATVSEGTFEIPNTPPVGTNFNIQIKSGSAPSGSGASFFSSDNFKYDFDNDVLLITGSQRVTGDVFVEGNVHAKQFIAHLSSSTINVSGSTQFGNSFDDTHIFTGLVVVSNGITGSISGSVDGVDVQAFSSSIETRVESQEIFSSSVSNIYSTKTQVTSSINTLSSSINTRVNNVSSSLNSSINSLSSSVSSTYLLKTSDTVQGNLTVTGTLTAQQFNTEYVSSSIIYESGSTKFGDSSGDVHSFTGSVKVTQGTISGSFVGDGTGLTGVTSYTDGDTLTYINSKGVFSGSSQVSHDSTTGFVANEHIDHASVSITAGNGLTGGGTIAATRTINVGAGTGIDVAADSISVDVSDFMSNGVNNRVITATGADAMNAEANLTFDGTKLTINNTEITEFDSGNTDIYSLLGGSSDGTLIAGADNGHVVIGIKEDNLSDSFAVIGGGGDFYSNTTYDKLLFRVSGSGNTYVGGDLLVSGSTTINEGLSIIGSLTATGNITAYYSSDERLKDNVTPIINAVDKVNALRGVEFDWNDKSEFSGHDIGVIAQDVEKVIPEIVAEQNSGYKAVRYEKIVALLIEAIKEQQLQIDELKSKL